MSGVNTRDSTVYSCMFGSCGLRGRVTAGAIHLLKQSHEKASVCLVSYGQMGRAVIGGFRPHSPPSSSEHLLCSCCPLLILVPRVRYTSSEVPFLLLKCLPCSRGFAFQTVFDRSNRSSGPRINPSMRHSWGVPVGLFLPRIFVSCILLKYEPPTSCESSTHLLIEHQVSWLFAIHTGVALL